MKYAALLRQIRQLRAALPQQGVTITITGGIPDEYKVPAPPPPGSDLLRQARLFRRPATARVEPAHAPKAAEAPNSKRAPLAPKAAP